MKIAILHSSNIGFFPRYYKSIYTASQKRGDEVSLFVPKSGRNKRNPLPGQVLWGTRINWLIHSRLHRLTGVQDVFSIIETISLIHKLKMFKPDLLHFNVINDKILCIPLLIKYINKHNIPVVWTMHDCRAFTGQCTYFDEVGCKRWKSSCGQCPICETRIDNTHITWKIRKKWHNGIHNLTIVTPSRWLADFVKQSFLKEHFVQVIYNGVDTKIFTKRPNYDVRLSYNIHQSKHIVLGCAVNWEKRKGLVFFEQLAEKLPSDYQIVLVGGIKEEKIKELSHKGIICTGRTKTVDELVAWYQSATVFCNPTLADNFPTVNIEALAAGTPIVTFKTGGSPEAINEHTGIVIPQGNTEALRDAVIKVAENRKFFTSDKCRMRSNLFTNKQYDSYIKLFHEITTL